jgi:hypothetical protein
MVVKGHHPRRHHDIHRRFQDVDPVAEPRAAAATGDVGPGRSEPRRLPPRAALGGDSDWPGLAPGFPLERRVTMKASEAQRADVVDGVTRLSPAPAGPERWLGVVRQHGPIENQGHGVRAVTFDAERAQGRSGRIPQVRAACRTTTIGVRPWVGETNIAAACRRFAAQPGAALALIGIRPDK